MWPQEYIELKHIEDLLVCGICYEYMETSVITSCSHNYCSLCIRKYLHYKTQCPVCFAETFEKDLRKNKVLDEIIVQFSQIKDKLKRCLRTQIQFMSCNRGDIILNTPKLIHENKVTHLSKIENKSISENSIFKNTSPYTNEQKDLSSPSTSGKTRIPLMFTPKSTKRLNVTNVEETKVVICPVCKVTISELNINRHLDDCLKREAIKDRPQIVESKRKPLPKLVFSLMKDVVIRKKLKEFGLSTQGDRKVMEIRLQRYIVLYNAECDKLNPRPVSELIKQCEDEENLEKKINKTSSFINKLQVNRNTEQNIIDGERKKYLETYKDSFDSLIRKIKDTDPSKNSSVRRSLLNESMQSNESNSHECQTVGENSDDSVNNTDKNEFLSINSGVYIEESDSDADCPLQMYSSTDLNKFFNVKSSPYSKSVPKNKCEGNYDEHAGYKEFKSFNYLHKKAEKDDVNSDTFSDISVSSKQLHSVMDTTCGKNTSKTDSKNACNTSKYKMLLHRKEELHLKDEIRRMDSVPTSKDFDFNSASNQEEADEKSTSVLQDILCDLSRTDSTSSKFNYEKSHSNDSIDNGFLNNSTINSSNLEKENISSSPECSGSRLLRKRNHDSIQNDNKIVSSRKKKIKKSSQCYPSEIDELNNEESVSTLNNNEKSNLRNKPRLRKRISDMTVVEDTTILRKSVRTKYKNNT